jgi:hypothetical protein
MVEGVKKLADQMVLTRCGRSSGYRRFLDSHKHGSVGATNYYTGQNVTKRKGKKCKGLEHGGREEGGRVQAGEGAPGVGVSRRRWDRASSRVIQ